MAFRAADVGFVSDFFSFFFIFMNRIIKNSKTEIHLNDNVTGNYFNLISDLFFFFSDIVRLLVLFARLPASSDGFISHDD